MNDFCVYITMYLLVSYTQWKNKTKTTTCTCRTPYIIRFNKCNAISNIKSEDPNILIAHVKVHVEPATHTKLEHAQAANAKLGRYHALFAHSVSFGDTAALKHISSSNFSLAHMCIDGGVHVH